jgi:hypothetical protein
MPRFYRRTLGFLASATVAVSLAVVLDAQGTSADVETLKQKVAAIMAFGTQPSKQPRQTALSEKELTAFLLHDGGFLQLPAGVVAPSLAIVGPGRFSASAVVDLDVVRGQRSQAHLLDPLSYLSGRLPVTATGLLETSNGVGRIRVESASVGGVAIPVLVLQELVSFYSRSLEKPQGISLDDPFPLPANIREIQVVGRRVIIVQ